MVIRGSPACLQQGFYEAVERGKAVAARRWEGRRLGPGGGAEAAATYARQTGSGTQISSADTSLMRCEFCGSAAADPVEPQAVGEVAPRLWRVEFGWWRRGSGVRSSGGGDYSARCSAHRGRGGRLPPRGSSRGGCGVARARARGARAGCAWAWGTCHMPHAACT